MIVPLSAWKLFRDGNDLLLRDSVRKQQNHSGPGTVFEYWREPCSLFLNELTKASREFRMDFSHKFRKFVDLNDIKHVSTDTDSSSVSCIETYMLMYECERILDYVDVHVDVQQKIPFDLFHVKKLEQEIEISVQLCQIFRFFHIQYQEWKDPYRRYFLEREWLKTQVLLAQTDTPIEQDFLEGVDSYVAAMVLLHDRQSAVALERVCVRLQERLHS